MNSSVLHFFKSLMNWPRTLTELPILLWLIPSSSTISWYDELPTCTLYGLLYVGIRSSNNVISSLIIFKKMFFDHQEKIGEKNKFQFFTFIQTNFFFNCFACFTEAPCRISSEKPPENNSTQSEILNRLLVFASCKRRIFILTFHTNKKSNFVLTLFTITRKSP